MVLSPVVLRPERAFTGESLQQHYVSDPSSRQRGCYKINPQLSKESVKEKEKLVTFPDGRLTPRHTGQL
jgi:hypothetical protein